MANLTSVGITAGVPTSGTGTVSTIDELLAVGAPIAQGGNTAAVKPASTAPLATDPALVVSISPNSVNANGQAAMANSAPVVIASNQASIPVAATLNAETTKVIGTVNVSAGQSIAVTNAGTFAVQETAATSGGTSFTRTLIPNNTTAVVIKSGAGQLYKVRATNNSATIAYIKLYNATSATAGSGTPVDTIMIPANTSGAGIADFYPLGAVYSTGITFIVTTGIADADTGTPAASTYIVTMFYK